MSNKKEQTPRCSQCDRLAVFYYGEVGLCVDHHLKMQQALYLQVSMLAAQLNYLNSELESGSGGLMRLPRINIPPTTFAEGNVTFNNINVAGSNIGAINTGTIKNLDTSITIIENQGNSDLAVAVTELTEAVIKSNEIGNSVKDEINQQLELLVSQVTLDQQSRSMGVIKSLLAGTRNSVSVVASLLTIWDRVEPIFKSAFGV